VKGLTRKRTMRAKYFTTGKVCAFKRKAGESCKPALSLSSCKNYLKIIYLKSRKTAGLPTAPVFLFLFFGQKTADLKINHLFINRAGFHEFLMGAAANHFSFLKYDDDVGMTYRRKTVGNNKCASSSFIGCPVSVLYTNPPNATIFFGLTILISSANNLICSSITLLSGYALWS
jgi:hypothetical protein